MRLLFCEDEYLTRLGVVQTLKWADMGIDELDTARNGQEGMEKLALLPDILLTDIRMPFISGLEIAEALKKQNPDSEVIIMSSYSDKEYLKKAIALSTVAYVEKPLNLAELEQSIRDAVSRRRDRMRFRELEQASEPPETFTCMPDPNTPGGSGAGEPGPRTRPAPRNHPAPQDRSDQQNHSCPRAQPRPQRKALHKAYGINLPWRSFLFHRNWRGRNPLIQAAFGIPYFNRTGQRTAPPSGVQQIGPVL